MKLKFTIPLLFVCVIGFSQSNSYSYQRELLGITSQWHSVVLPNEIFNKTATDFSDIRILGFTEGKDTIEAPYILKQGAEKMEQVTVPFTLINTSKNSNRHYFTFETPVETAVNQIQLDFESRNFDWRVALEGSQNQQEWFTILTDYRILSITTDNTRFQYTSLNFPLAKYHYFRLAIPSEENPELMAAKLFLNTVTEGNYNTYPIHSKTFEENRKNKETIITIDLKSKVPVSKLKLAVKNKYDYFRPIRINYLTDSIQTEKGWKYNYKSLTSGILNSLDDSEFSFQSTVFKRLQLVIENQDNDALQIDSLEVQGYVHELVVRFTEPATYLLTYGNPLVQMPNYDIKRFSNNIPTNLTALHLGKEQFIQGNLKERGKPLFQNSAWLWAVMLFSIVLLGWFSLKMIRQK